MNESDLLYYNGYGGFSLDGKEYIIKTCEKATPLPWSHVIANEMFGTIVTSNGGGYIWHGNSQSNKISSWSNDCLRDTPSEKIIIRFNNKSINLLPYDSSEKYTVIYGFGYAKYIYQDEDLKIETLIYVPTKISKKVYKIKINGLAADSDVVLEYWINPVLGVSREFTKNHIIIGNNNDSIIIKNKYREDYSDYDVYINSSGKLIEYKNVDSNLKMEISVNEYNFEKKCHEVQLEIGCFNYYEGNNLQDVKQDINLISCFWNDQMNSLKVYTPVESMNIMMNGWLLYQTLTCRMWARTSFYQAGGAFGFRDQLQDSLCLLWCNPEFTKNQILYHASHQFEEGDVLHWWHKEKNNGTRTRYTDDLLWLPFIVSKYIEFTGDKEILDIKVPYVKGEVLHDNEVERYMAVDTTSYDDTLYNHTVRAIKYGVKLSDNNLPKMNGGDWNDGMNQIKGQSIWLGFFIYTVLESFKSICDLKNDSELKKYCEDTLSSLKEGLNEHGWDGKWYRRAYFENGVPVGSSKNDECKIDGISQSWAVISGAGEKEKIIQAMESLDSYLVDKENMIIKLLTPPFDKTNLNPGYIKEYIPGVRENGGQYTHGAIWSVIANAMLKNGDRAGEYFRILNPIEHARTKENALRYKVEPYVMAADVYANVNMQGRGGWTWYTGSSSWFYIAGLEYVLGLKKKGDFLIIDPCVPHEWEEFSIEYLYIDTKYKILIKNPEHKSYGFKTISYDNNITNINQFHLVNDFKEHLIEIVL